MSNEQKINLWDSADSGMQRSWEREEAQRAMKWLDYPRFDTALAYLDPVPPLRRGTGGTQTKTISEKEKQLRALKKVTSSPDWLETIVTAYKREFARPVPPQRDALAIYRTMIACSRRKPYRDSEVTETMTDDFHLHTVLDPATVIATEMRGEPVFAAYAKGQNGTISDLTVHSVEGGKRTHWAAAEDKRAQVFARHEEEFRGYANYDTFPWPSPERMNDVSSGKRIWIQLWGQMCEYNVDYTKLFSPAGVIYVRRSSPGSSSLIFSKTQRGPKHAHSVHSLALRFGFRDGSVSCCYGFTGTVESAESTSFSTTMSVFSGTSANSSNFPVVGQGVSGMVVSSSHRSEVVKLFPAKHLAQHEAPTSSCAGFTASPRHSPP
ncbi:hypothetical protein B0H15DRAFT_803322 [Mycena belliarum]|uniref:Uncharacterized protein n=1 Tax=Mycena belliarum TaxID=1033014 RepID=A0AAD6U245_9AGAR|nr:hypothetical protein B0H15DRAFT_803322 [Mycena belliae]